MKNFTYKIEHDYGLAPNPFGGYCTLAVCKSSIRRNKNMQVGSWIFGTGSVKLKNLNKLIYAMRVDETLSFTDYWNDKRFAYKKPILNGSLPQLHGDNIYHKDPHTGVWIQENSAHSLSSGLINDKHLNRDLGGSYVLVSNNFYYFGENAIDIPELFHNYICTKSRDMEFVESTPATEFLLWLDNNHKKNIIHGDPVSWNSYFK